jgi:hypothetical protein
MVTEVSLPQPKKAHGPNSVTLFGMAIEVRPSHLIKASLPISVTLFGMVIEVRPLQPPKAHAPISVTLSGMLIEERPLQSLKALIVFTLSGIVIVPCTPPPHRIKIVFFLS